MDYDEYEAPPQDASPTQVTVLITVTRAIVMDPHDAVHPFSNLYTATVGDPTAWFSQPLAEATGSTAEEAVRNVVDKVSITFPEGDDK